MPSNLTLFIESVLHCTSSYDIMFGEIDQASLVVSDVVASRSMVVTGVENDTASTSSSSNAATQTIAKKKVPLLYEY
jgi:hypothetical protein